MQIISYRILYTDRFLNQVGRFHPFIDREGP